MSALFFKDLLLEARNRSMVSSLFVVGLLVLLIFEIALDPSEKEAARMAPGLLWTAVILASTIGLGRLFAIEREGRAFDALLIAPIDRGSIFLAKMAAAVVILLVFESLLLIPFAAFTGVAISQNLGELYVILLGGNLGIAAVGTLFAPAAHATRARELIMPLVVLPLEIPLIVAVVQATEMVLGGAALSELGTRATLLMSFDALFIAAGWLLFEVVAVD